MKTFVIMLTSLLVLNVPAIASLTDCRFMVLNALNAESNSDQGGKSYQQLVRVLDYGLNSSGIERLLSFLDIDRMLNSDLPLNPLVGRVTTSLSYSYSRTLDLALSKIKQPEDWIRAKTEIRALLQESTQQESSVDKGKSETDTFVQISHFATIESSHHSTFDYIYDDESRSFIFVVHSDVTNGPVEVFSIARDDGSERYRKTLNIKPTEGAKLAYFTKKADGIELTVINKHLGVISTYKIVRGQLQKGFVSRHIYSEKERIQSKNKNKKHFAENLSSAIRYDVSPDHYFVFADARKLMRRVSDLRGQIAIWEYKNGRSVRNNLFKDDNADPNPLPKIPLEYGIVNIDVVRVSDQLGLLIVATNSNKHGTLVFEITKDGISRQQQYTLSTNIQSKPAQVVKLENHHGRNLTLLLGEFSGLKRGTTKLLEVQSDGTHTLGKMPTLRPFERIASSLNTTSGNTFFVVANDNLDQKTILIWELDKELRWNQLSDLPLPSNTSGVFSSLIELENGSVLLLAFAAQKVSVYLHTGSEFIATGVEVPIIDGLAFRAPKVLKTDSGEVFVAWSRRDGKIELSSVYKKTDNESSHAAH